MPATDSIENSSLQFPGNAKSDKERRYLAPLEALLGRDAFPTYKELLLDPGFVTYSPALQDRVARPTSKLARESATWASLPLRTAQAFVSHQWLGREHPDPEGTHAAALRGMLQRLASGSVPKVELHPLHAHRTRETLVVPTDCS